MADLPKISLVNPLKETPFHLFKLVLAIHRLHQREPSIAMHPSTNGILMMTDGVTMMF